MEQMSDLPLPRPWCMCPSCGVDIRQGARMWLCRECFWALKVHQPVICSLHDRLVHTEHIHPYEMMD